MFVKSLIIFIFSLFAGSALGALPDESNEEVPPVFVEQEDGSFVLESGTIAIEQSDGSLILAHGGRMVPSGKPLTPEQRAWQQEAIRKKTLGERVIRILLPWRR